MTVPVALTGEHYTREMQGQFITDVFEGIGAASEGRITSEELHEIEKNACPGAGSCAGMFTANTMSSAFEVLGFSLPYSSTMAAATRTILPFPSVPS